MINNLSFPYGIEPTLYHFFSFYRKKVLPASLILNNVVLGGYLSSGLYDT